MRYLKRYKLFESTEIKEVDDIKEMIMDILLPISDMGYNISVNDTTQFTIRVVIYTDKPLKIDEDVKGEFDRMVYYLKSIGINNISVNYVKRNSTLNCSRSYDKFMDEVKEDPEFSVRNLLFIARV
jgi:hypothetical protein